MSFIQPCFIRKNTPELRAYLEGLGYSKIKQAIYYDNIMCANNNIWFVKTPFKPIALGGNLDGSKWEECIDCGTNEKLFKAIAVLRDDSDYLQWFKYNNKWYLCEKDNWIEMLPLVSMGREFTDDEARYYWITFLGLFHKATVDELIEKFK